MNVKDRLEEYIAYKGFSKSVFAKMIGKTRAYVNNISKGIGPETLVSISKQFPDLNLTWLLTGEGDMIVEKGTLVAGKTIEINVEAWTILKEQATILSRQMDSIITKDNQINDLIDMLKHLIYNNKTENKICVG